MNAAGDNHSDQTQVAGGDDHSDQSPDADEEHAKQVERAELLVEMLPYISRWRGKVVVVKLGGNAMVDTALTDGFAADIVLLRQIGLAPVVVHGGGPQIGDLMARLGKTSEFRDGLRVTDAETLDIARMVLVGKVNRDIVGAINAHGPLAVGISGEDGRVITATARNPDLGFVGEVTDVNTDLLERLLAEGLIPVISTIGADATGQAYNINADTVAGAVAAALEAEKVVYLTDVAGLLDDVQDPDSLIRRATADTLAARLAGGKIVGGMIPKIEACISAVRNGVNSAHLLDGRVPHVVLVELFTDAGVGTMITRDRPHLVAS
ncbi:acetylglutamate kinase [Candidatus Poriferisodalis sp.]|uniref:acetylglutamate kinase n=1 Tax=Candidatus Poriferisodalis sp. TaxID=3101277 RepID=UPI003AF55AED